jgi:osmotically-inducible protein OsmY
MTDVATRTDRDIRADVEAELEWEPSVDEGEIGVAVRDGIVTLTGRVPSFWQKCKAERVAERVNGVRGIANEIEVQLEHERSDADIARAAADALEWDTRIPSGAVKVKVENGWVTLRGEVDHDYQRRAAERAVRHLDGVRDVTNLITVNRGSRPPTSKRGSGGASNVWPQSMRATSRWRRPATRSSCAEPFDHGTSATRPRRPPGQHPAFPWFETASPSGMSE